MPMTGADAAAHLAATGKADRRRMAIWGASAGGFTALRALALTDVFAAGIARCAVVDPITWRHAAPKFQAHHADGLIGSVTTSRERSALHDANRIKRPVLILYGEDDAVTPIHESCALANALGADAQLITFVGEGHTRLRDWHEAGVWDRLHQVLLIELHAAGKLDWSRAVTDASHVRALKGGPKADRARSTARGRARNTTS